MKTPILWSREMSAANLSAEMLAPKIPWNKYAHKSDPVDFSFDQ